MNSLFSSITGRDRSQKLAENGQEMVVMDYTNKQDSVDQANEKIPVKRDHES